MARHDGHVLPDLLQPGLKVVFCGSAVGAVSARRGAYYAGPGNKFWPTLHEIGLTPHRFAPEEFPALPRLGIGLTDMAKQESGADSDLSRNADDPEAVAAKIRRYRPRVLAFTAKRPALVFFRTQFGKRQLDYGLQTETIGNTAIFVLPSTSGLAIRYWNIGPWQALADYLRDTPPKK